MQESKSARRGIVGMKDRAGAEQQTKGNTMSYPTDVDGDELYFDRPDQQADGDDPVLRLVDHAGEGPESAKEMLPDALICWDCGRSFAPQTPNQRECIRCYVEGKL